MSFAQKLALLNNAATVAVETDAQKTARLERLKQERQEENEKRVAAEYARQLNEIETMPATAKLSWQVFTALVWRIVAHALFGERAMKAVREAVQRNPFWFSNIDVFWYVKKTKDVNFGQMIQDLFLDVMTPEEELSEFEVIHYVVGALGATEAIAQIKSDGGDAEGAAKEREALKQLATYILNNFDLPSWLYDQLLHYVEPTGVFKPKQSEFMDAPQGDFQFVKLWERPSKEVLEARRRKEEVGRITALPALSLTDSKKEEKKEKKGLSPKRQAFEAAKKLRNSQKPNPQKLTSHDGKTFSGLAELRDQLPSAQNGTNGTAHA